MKQGWRMKEGESACSFDDINFAVIVVQSLSHVQLFMSPWTAAHQAPLSSTFSRSWLKFMSSDSVMLSNHLILCHSLLLLPSIFPSIRVFLNESAVHIRWPKYSELQLQQQTFQWIFRHQLYSHWFWRVKWFLIHSTTFFPLFHTFSPYYFLSSLLSPKPKAVPGMEEGKTMFL